MATNEPNKPDNVINIDTAKTSAEEKSAPEQPSQTVGEAPATEKTAEPDKTATPITPEEKAPDKQAARKGSPQKAEKSDKEPKAKKTPKKEKSARPKKAPAKEEAPAPEPEQPPEPRDATRNGDTEQIVYLNLSELHGFKGHPFGVRDDAEMLTLVESVKNGGVNAYTIAFSMPDRKPGIGQPSISPIEI